MLSNPRLSGPVGRYLISSASCAGDAQQSFTLWTMPAEGADQSWNWWMGLPAEGGEQSAFGILFYNPTESVDA